MRQLVYQVCCTRYQVSFYLWRLGPVLKHCKVPKYYNQDYVNLTDMLYRKSVQKGVVHFSWKDMYRRLFLVKLQAVGAWFFTKNNAKGLSIKHVRQIFRKSNISNPLITWNISLSTVLRRYLAKTFWKYFFSVRNIFGNYRKLYWDF